jgi:RHS repeat-associated protein
LVAAGDRGVVIEERVDENYTGTLSIDRAMQNIWGARYIDDLVARRKDANYNHSYGDSGDGTWYACTDVQFSVVALLKSTGALAERVSYDPYGVATYRYPDDVNGDGSVTSADRTLVNGLIPTSIGGGGYNADADINRDGIIDSNDYNLVSSTTKSALPSGFITDKSGPDNLFGYDGYAFNPESLLYTVRFRHYDPVLGRWLERDPARFTDGYNLYQACGSTPLNGVDPYGLAFQVPGPPEHLVPTLPSNPSPGGFAPQDGASPGTQSPGQSAGGNACSAAAQAADELEEQYRRHLNVQTATNLLKSYRSCRSGIGQSGGNHFPVLVPGLNPPRSRLPKYDFNSSTVSCQDDACIAIGLLRNLMNKYVQSYENYENRGLIVRTIHAEAPDFQDEDKIEHDLWLYYRSLRFAAQKECNAIKAANAAKCCKTAPAASQSPAVPAGKGGS